MRTLSAALTTAQQSNSVTPYLELRFLSRDGATERVYKTSDTPNQIMYVAQVESRDHENSIATAQGQFGTVIRLRDADNSIGSSDFIGYRLHIHWGMEVSGGPGTEVSISSPAFVWSQQRISAPGEIIQELLCISLWELADKGSLNTLTSSTKQFLGETELRQILMEAIGGVVPDKVWADDGGVFTDETADAKGFGTSGLVQIHPTIPVAADAFYVGGAELFNRISIDMHTAAVTTTVLLEYWNGSAWTSISTSTDEYSDNTAGFTVTGLKIISWQVPSNWATTAVNGSTQYWVRFRVTSVSGSPSGGKANKLTIGRDIALQLDTSDAAQGDDFKPHFITDYTLKNSRLAQQLLQYTLLGIYPAINGFHMRYVDNAETAEDYHYDTTGTEHIIYQGYASDTAILPNKLIFSDLDPDDVVATAGNFLTNNDALSASITSWGTFPLLVTDPSVTSTAIALTLATRRLAQLTRDRSQGYILAPMNVGQEVWDLARLNDSRLSNDFDGRVTRITRVFAPGIYTIEIELGNYIVSNIGSYEDLFKQLIESPTITPPLPPIEGVLRFLNFVGNQLTQGIADLQRVSVGGLFDLGPNPTVAALNTVLQVEIAAQQAARVAIALQNLGQPGIDLLEQIGVSASSAVQFGLAGVAPTIKSPNQLPDTLLEFTGNITPLAQFGGQTQPPSSPFGSIFTGQPLGAVSIQPRFIRIGRLNPQNIRFGSSFFGTQPGGGGIEVAPSFRPNPQFVAPPGTGGPTGFQRLRNLIGQFAPPPTPIFGPAEPFPEEGGPFFTSPPPRTVLPPDDFPEEGGGFF